MKRRRSKRSLKQDADEENLLKPVYIPLDITVQILWKLPLKSLVRFQCVSKLWYSSLIPDSIKTRSLTQRPSLLVLFHDWYSNICLSTYPLNTNTTFMSTDKVTRHNKTSVSDYSQMFQYFNGLVLCMSSCTQFAVYNPTTKQFVLLPDVLKELRYSVVCGFLGYDPVDNQYKVLSTSRNLYGVTETNYRVYTLASPKIEQWRNVVKSQDNFAPPFDTISPDKTSESVCINGIIYYLGEMKTDPGYALGRFNVRFETFDYIKMPKAVMDKYVWNIRLVNYQGKLGCISYKSKSASIWILEDIEKHEWSEISLSIPSHLLKTVGLVGDNYISGVTGNGHEIVIMPKRLDHTERLYAYFYDPKQDKTRRVELERNTFRREVGICCEPDHVENIMHLVLNVT